MSLSLLSFWLREQPPSETARILPVHRAVVVGGDGDVGLRCAPSKASRVVEFMLEHGRASFLERKVTCRVCLAAEEEGGVG